MTAWLPCRCSDSGRRSTRRESMCLATAWAACWFRGSGRRTRISPGSSSLPAITDPSRIYSLSSLAVRQVAGLGPEETKQKLAPALGKR